MKLLKGGLAPPFYSRPSLDPDPIPLQPLFPVQTLVGTAAFSSPAAGGRDVLSGWWSLEQGWVGRSSAGKRPAPHLPRPAGGGPALGLLKNQSPLSGRRKVNKI